MYTDTLPRRGPRAIPYPCSRCVTGLTRDPVVIAHRGASGYRPEHTLAAYRLAIALGADYVEPDLVPTRDGVLVARHEPEIGATTDVARRAEFAHRRTAKLVDGHAVTGWFVEDFTLGELRTLYARERLPRLRPGNRGYDGQFAVPTLDEILVLVRHESRRHGRPVGVYPEVKNPSYFASVGLAMEGPVVAALHRHTALQPGAPVYVQSFEPSCLRRLAGLTSLPLVQLVGAVGAPRDLLVAGDRRGYSDLVTPLGLREISTYAGAIGVHKDVVLPPPTVERVGRPTTVVDRAHSAGLLVHVWTLRDENHFLPPELRMGTKPGQRGRAAAEHRRFLDLGVDGVFTDFPDTAVAARAAHRAVGRRRLTIAGAVRS